jgi:hypothetical protein
MEHPEGRSVGTRSTLPFRDEGPRTAEEAFLFGDESQNFMQARSTAMPEISAMVGPSKCWPTAPPGAPML